MVEHVKGDITIVPVKRKKYTLVSKQCPIDNRITLGTATLVDRLRIVTGPPLNTDLATGNIYDWLKYILVCALVDGDETYGRAVPSWFQTNVRCHLSSQRRVASLCLAIFARCGLFNMIFFLSSKNACA